MEAREQYSFRQLLDREEEILITVRDADTQQAISLPVWFVHDDETLYLLPINGARTHWFRRLQNDPQITVRVGNQQITAQARPIVDEERGRALRQRFAEKYGDEDVERYYGHTDAVVEVPLR